MIGGGVTEYVVLLVYLIGMIGIGVYWAKHSKTSEDYLLGGRRIGSVLTALTLQTTSMSGYMFMGGPAQTYREGYFTLWYAVGDGGGAIFNVGIYRLSHEIMIQSGILFTYHILMRLQDYSLTAFISGSCRFAYQHVSNIVLFCFQTAFSGIIHKVLTHLFLTPRWTRDTAYFKKYVHYTF